ncbi:hypothetical protein TRIUR3_28253 [Triticum urartu]|uniref:Uncharacterized protein n=1 Tax=Triticum urartu TaxID=4572 RepID=M7YDI9_TRIUA|nr:hypothetical protein TRIUR3_28253 [Triticum urartu]
MAHVLNQPDVHWKVIRNSKESSLQVYHPLYLYFVLLCSALQEEGGLVAISCMQRGWQRLFLG